MFTLREREHVSESNQLMNAFLLLCPAPTHTHPTPASAEEVEDSDEDEDDSESDSEEDFDDEDEDEWDSEEDEDEDVDEDDMDDEEDDEEEEEEDLENDVDADSNLYELYLKGELMPAVYRNEHQKFEAARRYMHRLQEAKKDQVRADFLSGCHRMGREAHTPPPSPHPIPHPFQTPPSPPPPPPPHPHPPVLPKFTCRGNIAPLVIHIDEKQNKTKKNGSDWTNKPSIVLFGESKNLLWGLWSSFPGVGLLRKCSHGFLLAVLPLF